MPSGHVLFITFLVTAFHAPASAAQSVASFWDPGTFSMIVPPHNGELPPTASVSLLVPTVTLSSAPATITEPPSAAPTLIGLPPFACDSISECTESVAATPSTAGCVSLTQLVAADTRLDSNCGNP